MIVTDFSVYGLKDSIIASGFPMKIGGVPYLVGNSFLSDVQKRVPTATKLAQADAGSGHDCFLKGIIVQGTLRYSQAFTKQIQRYSWFDFVSSTSMMHKIVEMNIEENCRPEVDPRIIGIVEEKVAEYNANPTPKNFHNVVYNVPMGFQLYVRFTTNYLQLKTIYKQRRNHKLVEWQEFCDWIVHDLPYSHFITGLKDEE